MTDGWSRRWPISSSRRNRSLKTRSLAYSRCGSLSATTCPFAVSRARKIVAMPPRATTSSSTYWSSVSPGAGSAICLRLPHLEARGADLIRSATELPPGPRCRRRPAHHARDLHAQVVVSTLLARAPDECAPCRLRRVGADELGDLGLGEGVVDAVAHLDDDVAGADVEREDVDADDQLDAEAAREHVSARMGPGRLGREQPVLHLLPHPGVILRELGQAAVAKQEEPTVADVRREQSPAHDRAGCERRPHAAELGDSDCLVVDLEVRLLRGTPEPLAHGPAARGPVHLARHHLERERARDLARGAPADAVRDREQEAVLVRPVPDGVLVRLSDAADVGQLEELELGHFD